MSRPDARRRGLLLTMRTIANADVVAVVERIEPERDVVCLAGVVLLREDDLCVELTAEYCLAMLLALERKPFLQTTGMVGVVADLGADTGVFLLEDVATDGALIVR
jgi:hypothetical protein